MYWLISSSLVKKLVQTYSAWWIMCRIISMLFYNPCQEGIYKNNEYKQFEINIFLFNRNIDT